MASTEKSAAAGQGDVWDTGRIAGDQSIQIVHAGKPLASTARVYWRVKVWDEDGQASGWSDAALWSMGLLHPEDWKTHWIGKEESGDDRDPNNPY